MADDAPPLTADDRRLKHIVTDGRFRREFPREAEELDMLRVNVHRLMRKVNELCAATDAATGDAVSPVELFFPAETMEDSSPAPWEPFLREERDRAARGAE